MQLRATSRMKKKLIEFLIFASLFSLFVKYMPYIKVCHRSHCTNMENTFEEINNIERHTNTLKQRSFKKTSRRTWTHESKGSLHILFLLLL